MNRATGAAPAERGAGLAFTASGRGPCSVANGRGGWLQTNPARPVKKGKRHVRRAAARLRPGRWQRKYRTLRPQTLTLAQLSPGQDWEVPPLSLTPRPHRSRRMAVGPPCRRCQGEAGLGPAPDPWAANNPYGSFCQGGTCHRRNGRFSPREIPHSAANRRRSRAMAPGCARKCARSGGSSAGWSGCRA